MFLKILLNTILTYIYSYRLMKRIRLSKLSRNILVSPFDYRRYLYLLLKSLASHFFLLEGSSTSVDSRTYRIISYFIKALLKALLLQRSC